jgi:hypothetical protein
MINLRLKQLRCRQKAARTTRLRAAAGALSATIALLLSSSAFAEPQLWSSITDQQTKAAAGAGLNLRAYQVVALDRAAMTMRLQQAPLEFSGASKSAALILSLPNPQGGFDRFIVEESPMISSAVAAERPDWKTYQVRGVDNPELTGRISFSREGFRGYFIGKNGSYYIDPAAGATDRYVVFTKGDVEADRSNFHCNFERYLSADEAGKLASIHKAATDAPEFSLGTQLRTYKLAIATTGEYTVNRGGQASALTDVMNAVNRINQVYQKDLSIRFQLVSGTNTIFPDPNTDPYDNTDTEAQLLINHAKLNEIIGIANYDVGHLFGTGGGGVARAQSACRSTQKGEGYSARGEPTGDPFWVDYVAHEIGHQFAADHTYNTKETGTCTTRAQEEAVEPASGSTIMSYGGICGSRNLIRFVHDNFHVRSLTTITEFVLNGLPATTQCGTITTTGNNVPVIGALAARTIPKQTPFTLTASATDADNDTLTYNWEQNDVGAQASGPGGTPAGTYDVDSDGILRPLFRSYAPTSSNARTFPSLPFILNNANTPPLTYTGTSATGAVCADDTTCVVGEVLPAVSRVMNFGVTVRDGRGGIRDANVAVTVDGASGPFVVTSPNTNVNAQGGSAFTVTWNVANTNVAPVNAANVRILLSTDGGLTFPTELLASTANDGSEQVTMPNVATTSARIKIEAVGNIFFDISDANFTISQTTGPVPSLVVSRKVHGGTPFDVALPLTGAAGIECRSGGATNDYQVVFTFPSAVTFTSASVTAGTGSVASSSGSGTNSVTVNLTGVTSQQRITVTLNSVNAGAGTSNVSVQMGVLVGDVNADTTVNSGDTLVTRNASGQQANSTNFRSDVNVDGVINGGDSIAVRGRAGNSLP